MHLYKIVTSEIPWILYGEDEDGNFTFRFRNPLEADIFLRNHDFTGEQQIDLICYGNHGFKRVCTLINHFIDSNYYNLFYFFLFHFMDEDPNEIRPVFYLGYFLTKLNVRDFGIDKDYIEKIKRFDYKLTRNDKIIAKKIYNFFNDYFNQYIYDFYKVIDAELDKKHEYDM